ncbi:RHS repeat-associated core domain-containing protein [Pseudomonas putida]
MRVVPVSALAFCGQHLDPLTGSYPLGNGHRFYRPSLRRFISPDVLSPFGKGGSMLTPTAKVTLSTLLTLVVVSPQSSRQSETLSRE